MEFRLLGPLEVVDDDGRTIPLERKQVRALLAFLLLHANEIVSSDVLIDALWGSAPPRAVKARSEERRVGKECRYGWSPDHEKEKAVARQPVLPDSRSDTTEAASPA